MAFSRCARNLQNHHELALASHFDFLLHREMVPTFLDKCVHRYIMDRLLAVYGGMGEFASADHSGFTTACSVFPNGARNKPRS